MNHIGQNILPITFKPGNTTERGEILKYFAAKLGMNIPRVAYHLTGFKEKDLFFLKSLCDQEERRGEAWTKIFWGSLKIRT